MKFILIIMQCLISYVGIRGCGIDTAPLSTIYINSLPGVSMKMMDKIADEETKTFMGVWDEINQRAALRFESEVNRIMNERYKLCSYNQVINLGKVLDEVVAPLAEWRGYTIERNHGGDNHYKNSSLLSSCSDEIFIYSSGIVASVPVKVFNLDTAEILYSTTVSLIAGWNTVEIDRCFTEENIAVAYWGENVTSKKIILYNCGDCDCGCCESHYTGVSSADMITNTYEKLTKGISGCFYQSCSWENLVCCTKKKFAYAWQLCLGTELMVERITTDRLNRYTTIDLKKGQTLRNEFDSEFKAQLESTLKGISIDQNDCCVECNEPLTIKEYAPY